jgi:hypothetical protein
MECLLIHSISFRRRPVASLLVVISNVRPGVEENGVDDLMQDVLK